MNKKDIEKWTREAGGFDATPEFLAKFADLVVSAERETWEQRYLRLHSLINVRETQPNKPCCLVEREACAKMCEDEAEKYLERALKPKHQRDINLNTARIAQLTCFLLADKIRARGQA
jgi:hypothetical protein